MMEFSGCQEVDRRKVKLPLGIHRGSRAKQNPDTGARKLEYQSQACFLLCILRKIMRSCYDSISAPDGGKYQLNTLFCTLLDVVTHQHANVKSHHILSLHLRASPIAENLAPNFSQELISAFSQTMNR
jgi:hypothetical protein